MPGNRFAFPVRVGREIERIRLLHGATQCAQVLLGFLDRFVVHLEVAGRLDRPFPGDEITNVAIGSEDLEAGPEVLLDRAGLGRGLDDDQMLRHGDRLARPAVAPGNGHEHPGIPSKAGHGGEPPRRRARNFSNGFPLSRE